MSQKRLSVAWSQILSEGGSYLKPLKRHSTGNLQIDSFFGSRKKDGIRRGGIPVGHVYLVGSQRGMGKTRWLVDLFARVCGPRRTNYNGDYYGNLQGLYIQGEEDTHTFAPMFCMGIWDRNTKVHISDNAFSMDQHEELIHKIKPDIIVIDSKDKMRDWANPRDLSKSLLTYNKWAREHGFTVFVISHVNSRGRIRGGTTQEHDVRGIILGQKEGKDGAGYDRFSLKMDKNRGGQSGGVLHYRHRDENIELLPPLNIEQFDEKSDIDSDGIDIFKNDDSQESLIRTQNTNQL